MHGCELSFVRALKMNAFNNRHILCWYYVLSRALNLFDGVAIFVLNCFSSSIGHYARSYRISQVVISLAYLVMISFELLNTLNEIYFVYDHLTHTHTHTCQMTHDTISIGFKKKKLLFFFE